MNVNNEKIIRAIRENGPAFALGLMTGALFLAALERHEEIKRGILKVFSQLTKRD
jgi:hypothetical protein